MYKLTIETKGYNKSSYLFDGFDEMADFAKKAVCHSSEESTKVIIEIAKEGAKEYEV